MNHFVIPLIVWLLAFWTWPRTTFLVTLWAAVFWIAAGKGALDGWF